MHENPENTLFWRQLQWLLRHMISFAWESKQIFSQLLDLPPVLGGRISEVLSIGFLLVISWGTYDTVVGAVVLVHFKAIKCKHRNIYLINGEIETFIVRLNTFGKNLSSWELHGICHCFPKNVFALLSSKCYRDLIVQVWNNAHLLVNVFNHYEIILRWHDDRLCSKINK